MVILLSIVSINISNIIIFHLFKLVLRGRQSYLHVLYFYGVVASSNSILHLEFVNNRLMTILIILTDTFHEVKRKRDRRKEVLLLPSLMRHPVFVVFTWLRIIPCCIFSLLKTILLCIARSICFEKAQHCTNIVLPPFHFYPAQFFWVQLFRIRYQVD